MPVSVCNYRDPRLAINTTSRAKGWSRGLSPFLLGPCPLYDGYVSRNMENGWQFSKVYKDFADEDGNPTPEYFEWAQEGWNNPKAVRYPMGKGKKPLYTWWDGEKLDYPTARKKVYIPLYANAVMKSEAFSILKSMYDRGEDLLLRDFDGYDYVAEGMTIREVMADTSRKMGHAFVLAMLLNQDWG